MQQCALPFPPSHSSQLTSAPANHYCSSVPSTPFNQVSKASRAHYISNQSSACPRHLQQRTSNQSTPCDHIPVASTCICTGIYKSRRPARSERARRRRQETQIPRAAHGSSAKPRLNASPNCPLQPALSISSCPVYLSGYTQITRTQTSSATDVDNTVSRRDLASPPGLSVRRNRAWAF